MTEANERGIKECCRRVNETVLHQMREATLRRIDTATREKNHEERTHAQQTLEIVDAEITSRMY